MMDWLHIQGVHLIQSLQHNFKSYDEVMLFLSHLGDPRNAFLVYFPIAMILNRSTGIKVMWAGVLAEWFNAILKWLLHGERPYWWVNETSVYTTKPILEQYRLTCETGPGSPSGHAMVTAAVCYLLLHQVAQRKQRSNVALWVVFILLMSLVCTSRCYIATHFPHQVLFGTAVGVGVALMCIRLPTDNLRLSIYTIASMVMLLTVPALYWLLTTLGSDPLWTLQLAQKWCAKKEWVHLDTTLFFAITRDISSLLGMAFGLWHMADKNINMSCTLLHKIVTAAFSLLLTRGLEYVAIPQHNMILFYLLAFLRYFILMFVVTVGIPKLLTFLAGGLNKSRGKNKD